MHPTEFSIPNLCKTETFQAYSSTAQTRPLTDELILNLFNFEHAPRKKILGIYLSNCASDRF